MALVVGGEWENDAFIQSGAVGNAEAEGRDKKSRAEGGIDSWGTAGH